MEEDEAIGAPIYGVGICLNEWNDTPSSRLSRRLRLKVLVTGATGFVGRYLCRELFRRGHDINILSRRQNVSIDSLPIKTYQWKNTSENPPVEAFDGVDALINLMGEPIIGGIFTKSKEKRIWSSRVTSTKSISRTLTENGIKLKSYVGASAIGAYPYDKIKRDEHSPLGDHYLARLCQDWEKAHRAISCQNSSIVRIGLVLGATSPLMNKLMQSSVMRHLPRFGDGQQLMNWVHIDDLVSILVRQLESNSGQVINAVSPNPCTQIEFNQAIASFFSHKVWQIPVSKFLINLGAGKPGSVLTETQYIVPSTLQSNSFEFKYTDVKDALKNCLSLAPHPRTGNMEPCFLWQTHQYLDKTPEDIWPFFSDPLNLEKITPELLHFKVLNRQVQIEDGSTINYRLKVHQIPVTWKTLIQSYKPPHQFVDTQLKGPYRIWHHTHDFQSVRDGTIMTDTVKFQLPCLPAGILAYPLVSSDVAEIFEHRRSVIAKIFAT